MKALGRQNDSRIDGSHREHSLQHPAGAHRMAIVGFHRIDRHLTESGAVDGDSLHLVVEHGRRTMGADKRQLTGVNACGDSRQRTTGTLGGHRRRTEVMGIVTHGAGHHMPRQSDVIAAGEHDRSRCLTEVQPHAVDVERLTALRRHGFERLEAGDDEAALLLGATHHGIVVEAHPQQACGKDDGRHPRDARIVDDNWLSGEAHCLGNGRGSGSGPQPTVVSLFLPHQGDVALRRTEDEHRAGTVHAGFLLTDMLLPLSDSATYRGDGHRLKAGTARLQPVHRRVVETRGHERLRQLPETFPPAHGGLTTAHGVKVGGRRGTKRRQNMMGCDTYHRSNTFHFSCHST